MRLPVNKSTISPPATLILSCLILYVCGTFISKQTTIAIALAKVLQLLNDSVMIFCSQMIPTPANVENHWNPRRKQKVKHLNAEA